MSEDLARLVRRARRGCEDSARALWKATAPSLRAHARILAAGLPDLDGDDLVQQTFLELLRMSPRRIRSIRDPLALLHAILRSRAINARRACSRRRRHERATHLPAVAPAPRAEPPVLDPLALSEREIVILRHACGLTFSQIACATRQPRSTVADRYRRAIERLRGQQQSPVTTGGTP